MLGVRRSLRTRIMISAGVGVTLLLVILTLEGAQILEATTQQVMAEWRGSAIHSASHLASQIEQDQIRIAQLGAELAEAGIEDSSQAALPMMERMRGRLAVFGYSLLWLGPDGQLLGQVPEELPATDVVPGLLAAVLPPAGEAYRFSGLELNGDGRPIATYAARFDQLGTLVAVANLEADPMGGFLPRTATGGHAALVDGQAWVLAATVNKLRFTRREHPEWVTAVMQEGTPVVSRTDGTDERHVMAFSPVGRTGWGLVLGEPAEEALAPIAQLRYRILLLGMAAVAVVLGYAWWDTGAVIAPLQGLTELAGRIAAGDLAAPVAVRRNDEIGALARAFEAMRVQLSSSREELERALDQARRRSEETAALYAVSQEILHPGGQGDALGTVADRARELLGGQAAAVCVAEGPGEPLRPVAATIPHDAWAEPCAAGPGDGGEGPSSPWCALARGECGQLARAPVSGEGAASGYLCVALPPTRALRPRDQTLLAGLAGLATLALAHERLQSQSRTLAVFAERERIARELHDSVSQSLSYLYSQLELLREQLPTLSVDQVRAELQALSGVASVAFEEARDSIFSLRAEVADREPLPNAISGCVRDFTARTGVAVDLATDAMAAVTLAGEAEAQLIRVVQEALANVARHSRATRVSVRAESAGGELQVTVQDNGVGFDPQTPRAGGRSFGLQMMRGRAESVGGRVDIESGQGHGTRIRVSIPLAH